ncbi:MAG TPA: DUF5663 domain-containing protein [Candidatus Binatia bacterium]|nr:DUF5663 domain-containing protein [Candidatus Binatia bacterium]
MAFKLDNQLLEELGLAALPPQEKQAILRQILETLEMRVGTTLASRMSDAQLDEFERLMPAEGDDQNTIQQKEQQALQWLESNFPNYKQVVNDELEKLKAEIRQSAPQILSNSQQNSSSTLQPPAPVAPVTQSYEPMAPPAPTTQTSPQPAPYIPQQPVAPNPYTPPVLQTGYATPPPSYYPQQPLSGPVQPSQPSYPNPTPPPASMPPSYSPFPPSSPTSDNNQPYPPQAPYPS